MQSKRTARNGAHGGQRDRDRDDADSIRDGLTSLREQAGEGAMDVVERLKGGGQRFLNGRKLGAASELSHVTAAMRRAADELYDHGSALAGYVDTTAEYVSAAAQYLEVRELNELVEDAQALARRKPMLFLGGMFAAGLAAARFLKAAAPPPSSSRRTGGRASGRKDRG